MRKIKMSWLAIVGIILASVILCGIFVRLTDGFSDFSFEADLNEDNLFFDQIEDGRIYGNDQVDAIAENGVITLNGSIVSTGTGSAVLSDPIELCTITLEKGTYTFTCFDHPNRQQYYAVGTYDENMWYADWEEAPYNPTNDPSLLGRTVTLTEETEVTFYIYLCEGATLKDVKAAPVLVPGIEPGELTVGLFD
jgi:hypothetical protein